MLKNKFTTAAHTLLLIGSSIGTSSECAPTPTDFKSDSLENLDEMIDQALEAFHIPGAAVGIVIDGKIVSTKGYGWRDLEKNLPVTEDTLFAIGSCTKAFTTHVLAQLVDEEKISWDDPVIKHLSEFRLKDEYATSHITIRDLVTHQSGLPRHDLLWYKSDLFRNELLPCLQHLDANAELRSKFQYNNLMYLIAGLVIERVTDQTWEEAVYSRIFTPLNLYRSKCSVSELKQDNDFSLPFREKNGAAHPIPFCDSSNVGPAGSIHSSIADMARWVALQLSDGTFEGRQLVKKETLRAMHTPQVALGTFPEESSDFFGYGLGWFTGIHEGHYLVAHGGGIDGFISETAFLPKEKIGVVVLTNSDNSFSFARGLSHAVLNCILGVEKEDWTLHIREKDEKVRKAFQKQETDELSRTALPRPLQDYAGTFEHPGYGTARVHREDENLILSYNSFSMVLDYRCEDQFIGKIEGIFDLSFLCSFKTAPSGEISELRVPLEKEVEPIIFSKGAGSSQ